MRMSSKGLFGSWLRAVIEREGITVNELANEIGLSRTSVSYHLNGKRKPHLYAIKKYAEYFGVNLWFVYNLVESDYGKLK